MNSSISCITRKRNKTKKAKKNNFPYVLYHISLRMSITNSPFAKKKTRAPLWGTLAKTLNYIMILLFIVSN